jgi:glutamine synthetase
MAYSVSKSKNIIVEYIWLGLDNEIFSKVRILSARQLVDNRSSEYISHLNIPDWDFDGSSTGQATTEASEVILKPCALYKNPFCNKELQSFFVLCSTYSPDGKPLESNTRHNAVDIFLEEAVYDQDIWFGIEFEYMMYSKATGQPITENNNKRTNYCSPVATGKNIVEEHMMLCLEAGIGYDGYNSEVVDSQWE